MEVLKEIDDSTIGCILTIIAHIGIIGWIIIIIIGYNIDIGWIVAIRMQHYVD